MGAGVEAIRDRPDLHQDREAYVAVHVRAVDELIRARTFSNPEPMRSFALTEADGARALSVLIESEPKLWILVSRVFFTRTGIHFARKRFSGPCYPAAGCIFGCEPAPSA